MIRQHTDLGYPTKKQSRIWNLRWHNISVTEIAKQLKISKPMVSKAYKIAQNRIENLIIHTASTFRVNIQNISPEFGFAVGHCSATESRTFITYTPSLGVQTWFSHDGDCERCDSLSMCNEYLTRLAEDWGETLDESLPPTRRGLDLFRKMMRRLNWNE